MKFELIFSQASDLIFNKFPKILKGDASNIINSFVSIFINLINDIKEWIMAFIYIFIHLFNNIITFLMSFITTFQDIISIIYQFFQIMLDII
jgi:hypothetical protein